MKIDVKKMVDKLNKVRIGLAQRELIEQSTSFLFWGGKIVTYNDEVACSISSGLPEDIQFAIPSQEFGELLNHLEESEIDLEVGDGSLKVIGDNKEAVIRTGDVKISLQGIGEPDQWTKLPDNFWEGVPLVCGACAVDKSQFVLTCVHLTDSYLEGTNRFQVLRYPVQLGEKWQPVIVRSDALLSLCSFRPMYVSQTEAWLHFLVGEPGGDEWKVSCRLYREKYPELDRFFDVKGKRLLLPEKIGEVIDRASIFASQQQVIIPYVQVSVKGTQLHVEARGDKGVYKEWLPMEGNNQDLGFYMSVQVMRDMVKLGCRELIVGDVSVFVDSGSWWWIAAKIRPVEQEQG